MKPNESLKIALVGNPHLGKTTLFNKLCGLNQRTGNYPGVTVDKKKGYLKADGKKIEIVDLPGINGLYPNSKDEELVVKYLLNSEAEDYPDKIVLIVSALNLKRNLFLYEQIRDLNIPLILAVNMVDLAAKRGIFIDMDALSKAVDIPIVKISAKKGTGFTELIALFNEEIVVNPRKATYIQENQEAVLDNYAELINEASKYKAFLAITEPNLTDDQAEKDQFILENEVNVREWKTNASILRYKHIKTYFDSVQRIDKTKATDLTSKLDRILLHPIFGIVIFIGILFSIFQSIFWLNKSNSRKNASKAQDKVRAKKFTLVC
jgi:ferrous iron transport protein B